MAVATLRPVGITLRLAEASCEPTAAQIVGGTLNATIPSKSVVVLDLH